MSLTALRLFDERGYDDVSMDEIALTTGVSRRYLFRLFPSKAALVWGGLDDFIDRLRASLRTSTEEDDTVRALTRAYEVAAAFSDETIEITRRRLRVIDRNPGLSSEGASRVAELTDFISAFLAARDGRDARDLEVTVMAHAVTAAASAALTWWARASDDRPETVVLRGISLVLTPLE